MIDDRSTNWCVVPCPHPEWAKLVYPGARPRRLAYERLWSELWHVLRLDEPDPNAAWEERIARLTESAAALNADASTRSSQRPRDGADASGCFRARTWLCRRLRDARTASATCRTCRPRRSSRAPDPERVDGHVTSTKPLVLTDGTIVRGLRVRFEGGRAVEIDADENGEALRVEGAVDDGGTRLGEVALVDSQGRIGPLGTVFYDTLLDENAASHIALGNAYSFNADEPTGAVLNDERDPHRLHDRLATRSRSRASPGTASGSPVLRDGDWQN